MNWLARLKAFICRWTTLVEFCHRCGKKQPLVWWCDSAQLWHEVTGKDGNGIYCPKCFDELADEKRISLRWRVFDDYRF